MQAERRASDLTNDQVATPSNAQQDSFEATYKELRKWADVKASKYGTLSVIREIRSNRPGTALKVCCLILLTVDQRYA